MQGHVEAPDRDAFSYPIVRVTTAGAISTWAQ
jgi:hypothetical protein